LALAAVTASADTLVLSDGDTLFGEFLKITDGALFFRTHLAGKVIVPTDEVDSLRAEPDMTIALADGRHTNGRLVIEQGVAHIIRADGADHAVELGAIAAAAPRTGPPLPSVAGSGAPDDGLHGAWETGVLGRLGDDDYGDLFAKLTLRSENAHRAFSARAFFERADEESFPRWLMADIAWLLRPGAATYPFLDIAFERDTDKALSGRGDLTVGFGRTIVDGEGKELRGDVGLNAETSHYDRSAAGYPGGVPWLLGDQHKDRQRLNLRLGLRYARAILANGQVNGRLSVYPSLTDWGALRARSESSVVFPVGQRLSLKLNLLLDYEGEPEFAGLDHWRTSIGASVMWGF